MAEDKPLKDVIALLSMTLSEGIAYPLTTALTRVQAHLVGPLNPHRGIPAFTGGFSLLATVPSFLLKLAISDAVYARCHQQVGVVPSYVLTSLITDAFVCFVRAPAELYRQQMQAGVAQRASEVFQGLWGHHGTLGLWRGFWIFYLREVSFNAGRMIALLNMQEHHRNE